MFSFHVLIYLLYNCKAVFFLYKVSIVLSMHFPHLGHIYFFLYFYIGCVFCPKSGILEEEKPPYFTIFFHETVDISYKNILFFLWKIDDLKSWHAIDSFFILDWIKVINALVLEIILQFGSISYQASLVDETSHEIFFLLYDIFLFLTLLSDHS